MFIEGKGLVKKYGKGEATVYALCPWCGRKGYLS